MTNFNRFKYAFFLNVLMMGVGDPAGCVVDLVKFRE
jgi:hypothetical protein